MQLARDFIFVRHGQTLWSHGDILKGPMDLNLNEIGRCQANDVLEVIKKHKTINDPIIYSSSLIRASETAKLFVEKLPLKPFIIEMDGLKERYYGNYCDHETNHVLIDAESEIDFQHRVEESLIKIFKNTHDLNNDLIIFSHQKVLEYLAQWLAGENLRLDHCGVCYFKFLNGKYCLEMYKSS